MPAAVELLASLGQSSNFLYANKDKVFSVISETIGLFYSYVVLGPSPSLSEIAHSGYMELVADFEGLCGCHSRFKSGLPMLTQHAPLVTKSLRVPSLKKLLQPLDIATEKKILR
ncbi:hypothetical protein ENBRE01_0065 [Enteropsectra breve]|nr:hypothetical protein ENBRE01_0065 [Enteropsectra breve]